MNRPILIAVIGYIIGIIVGLYLQISIVPFYLFLAAIFLIQQFYYKKKNSKKLKLFSIKRYFRYIKINFKIQVIAILIISSFISNNLILTKNNQYKKIYNELEQLQKISIEGIVINKKEEKQYYNRYLIKTKYNNTNIKLYINVKDKELEYGDQIKIEGTYIKPEEQRNYKGFDYSEYLKQLNIYGTINCQEIKIIRKKQCNLLFYTSNLINQKIENKIKKVLPKEYASIILGLVLGNTSEINEETQENFRNASMSHILAVSGMHVTYLLIGINIILKKIIGKRKTNIFSIVFLIFYMFLTNFSPSITRAGIMGILLLISNIIYRKNDIYTSISISLLIILIYNSYQIKNLGILLSYGGVIGILLFNKTISKILENIKIKNTKIKYKITPKIQKIIDKIKEIISISISVQLIILPITLYQFNTLTPYFLISNLILGFVIGPIVVLSFLFIIIILINEKLGIIFVDIIGFLIQILLNISKIANIPFAKIYIPTPSIIEIIIYYVLILLIKEIYIIYFDKRINQTQKRAKNIIELIKYKFRKNKKVKKIIISILIIGMIVIKFIPQKLRIYFVDVGQGDSTFIVTPCKKTILIDGGGSEVSDYDVGKNTLLPYILDRGFSKIDVVIISHFDSDHIGGILTILENIKVQDIYISKQKETSENYKKFIKIVKSKNINIKTLKKGDKIQVEKNVYFDILWPSNDMISEDALNNNSILCKLNYNNFSMLFTGDIEEIAEKQILEDYKKTDILNSTILKVAHHGSKTSSIQQFLKEVKPKIAIIGVGKNNKFGHPNDGVINRLEDLRDKSIQNRFKWRNNN